MRIVIDMQGAQSESRTRGIGRYSSSIVAAIVRNRGSHEIVLALNGLLPDGIASLRAAFRDLLPPDNIRLWYAPGPVRGMERKNEILRQRAEIIRDGFLASLSPDLIYVTSLFEGFVDDAVVSIGPLTSRAPTAVMLYDLIPLHDSQRLLTSHPELEQWYFRKLQHLKRADVLLAISEATAVDAKSRLGLSTDSIVNVSAGCSAHCQPKIISQAQRQALLSRLGISYPFVLTSGTAEPHKNLDRLFRTFAGLPADLSETHCIVLVGKANDVQRALLREMARKAGLNDARLIIAGHVSDDDLIALYNLCIAMIFPSYDEGFGLPVLEAMACDAPVLASNATSLPEIIGRHDALFDPHDDASIGRLLQQVLTSPSFRAALSAHGLDRAPKFSWETCAKSALAAMEALVAQRATSKLPALSSGHRPKLAYVSPLPPERTGVADYSAQLIPPLAKHYEITAIVDQSGVTSREVRSYCEIRDADWFIANTDRYDRVIYHMGNSPFHHYMLGLIRSVPGTIVLHDFFLGGIFAQRTPNGNADQWCQALHDAHGYGALLEHLQNDYQFSRMKYPANAEILSQAQGVIVHAEHSRHLAQTWFGAGVADDWAVVPMIRSLPQNPDRNRARASLSLSPNAFLICSFGALDPVKLSDKLSQAFLSSQLGWHEECHLVFVGENHGGGYGAALRTAIKNSSAPSCIRITGWVDRKTYNNYLAAADLCVQLRTDSRGETSLAVFDGMSYGLPTIVNAHGSLAELPGDAVCMLDDGFDEAVLATALEMLWRDSGKRISIGRRAQMVAAEQHAPELCAQRYFEAIEQFHVSGSAGAQRLVGALTSASPDLSERECCQLAASIARSIPARRMPRQILLDVTQTCRSDLKTGIERVARALTLSLLRTPPSGYRVEPVFLCCEGGVWRYRYARRFTLHLMESPDHVLQDDLVEAQPGDLLIGLDMSGTAFIDAEAQGLFRDYRNHGVSIHFVVYDLLPLLSPQHFPPDADKRFKQWLNAVLRQDGALCISRTTAEDLRRLPEANALGPPFRIGWFHQGADFESSAATRGQPKGATALLARLMSRPTFLAVSTIEPRKGHLQTVMAFEELWTQGVDVNLLIVGAEGWKFVPQSGRRNISAIVHRLRSHPEHSNRLFWLEGTSDEYLKNIYAASTCLISASEGEGFGLPLIEAARHGVPVLARDIAVFREVAGDHATYFAGLEPRDLADAVKNWLMLYRYGAHQRSDAMPWITWKESAAQMMALVLHDVGDQRHEKQRSTQLQLASA